MPQQARVRGDAHSAMDLRWHPFLNALEMLLVTGNCATRCVQLLQLVFPWAPKIHMSQYSTGIQYNIFITLYITRTFHHFHAQSDITPTAEVYKTVFLFVYSHRAAAHQY